MVMLIWSTVEVLSSAETVLEVRIAPSIKVIPERASVALSAILLSIVASNAARFSVVTFDTAPFGVGAFGATPLSMDGAIR